MYHKSKQLIITWLSSLLCSSLFLPNLVQAEEGVSDSAIVIGGVMDLDGRTSGLGMGMKLGIEAAIKDVNPSVIKNSSSKPSTTLTHQQKRWKPPKRS